MHRKPLDAIGGARCPGAAALAIVSVALTLLIPLFTPVRSSAQSLALWNQFGALEKQYMQQRNADQWDAAKKTAEQMSAFARERRLPMPAEYIGIDYVARVEIQQGNYDRALETYGRVADLRNQRMPDNPSRREVQQQLAFNGLNGIALCYLHTSENDKAEQAFLTAIEYARNVRLPHAAATGMVDLGHLLYIKGEYARAREQFEAALPTLRVAAQKQGATTHHYAIYASALQGMAKVHMKFGQYNKAEPLARAAIAWMESTFGNNHTECALMMSSLADIYVNQNRDAEAVRLYEQAVRIFSTNLGPEHPRTLDNQGGLAVRYALAGRVDEGVAMAQAVLKVVRDRHGEEFPDTLWAKHSLATIYYLVNQYDQAAALLNDMLEISQRTLPKTHAFRLASLRLAVSNEFHRDGDMKKVVSGLNSLIDLYESGLASPGDLAYAYSLRAFAQEKMGQRKAALPDVETAVKHAELQRQLASGGERERATLFTDFNLIYGYAMLWHAEQGGEGLAEAFAIAERTKARSFVDALHAAEFDMLAGLSAAERSRFQAADKQLKDAITRAQQAYDAAVANKQGEAELRRRGQEVYAARDRYYQHLTDLQNANPNYRNLISDRSQHVTLASVQSELLQPGELLLSYVEFDNKMVVFSVRQDSVHFTELQLNDSQAAALGVSPGALGKKKLAAIFLGDAGLLNQLSRPQESPGLHARLAALWEALIPPADRQSLTDGSLQLATILPDGLLALLPFEALVVAQEEAQPKYLLDVGPPVAYAPSASVLMNLARRPAREAPAGREPLLTLGDPAYGQPASSSDRAARVRSGLSRLPHSGHEAAWVAQHFGKQNVASVTLTRGEATESRLRSLIPGREIVHLACHGITEDLYGNFFGCLAVSPGRGGDASDDGFLYTQEIYDLDLGGCELAILSACETNFGPQQTGEGVWTISRGFLVSGARRVVASNWIVDDQAGATLVSYYANFLAADSAGASGRKYAQALQQAKQSLRKDDRWSHPFYWSGLVLVGPK